MPDALSKTIPIWCAVMNRLLFEEKSQEFRLYTPDAVVSRSEHSQIEARIPALVEEAENGYIQGAGDDSEGWSHGLTPALFWTHEEALRNTNEEELPEYIQKLLREHEHGMMMGGPRRGKATLIHPTKNIYIGPLACINDPAEWDAIIVCNPTNPFAPTTNIQPKPQILHLPTALGKP
ncbi:MAG: hypothetical protein Q9203_002603, partial [Teloschistes exilis]